MFSYAYVKFSHKFMNEFIIEYHFYIGCRFNVTSKLLIFVSYVHPKHVNLLWMCEIWLKDDRLWDFDPCEIIDIACNSDCYIFRMVNVINVIFSILHTPPLWENKFQGLALPQGPRFEVRDLMVWGRSIEIASNSIFM